MEEWVSVFFIQVVSLGFTVDIQNLELEHTHCAQGRPGQ